MERVYGNRIQQAYRWAVAVLVVVPVLALATGAFAGLVEAIPAGILTALGVGAVALYCAGGTVISADPTTVRVALFPLWRKRIPVKRIQSIAVEPVAPIGREWGNRGSLRRSGETFVDAGHSTWCVAFHLFDGTVVRIGVESPEWGNEIVDELGRVAAR